MPSRLRSCAWTRVSEVRAVVEPARAADRDEPARAAARRRRARPSPSAATATRSSGRPSPARRLELRGVAARCRRGGRSAAGLPQQRRLDAQRRLERRGGDRRLRRLRQHVEAGGDGRRRPRELVADAEVADVRLGADVHGEHRLRARRACRGWKCPVEARQRLGLDVAVEAVAAREPAQEADVRAALDRRPLGVGEHRRGRVDAAGGACSRRRSRRRSRCRACSATA